MKAETRSALWCMVYALAIVVSLLGINLSLIVLRPHPIYTIYVAGPLAALGLWGLVMLVLALFREPEKKEDEPWFDEW